MQNLAQGRCDLFLRACRVNFFTGVLLAGICILICIFLHDPFLILLRFAFFLTSEHILIVKFTCDSKLTPLPTRHNLRNYIQNLTVTT